MSATANVAARLVETIGPKHVVAAAEELEAYAIEGLIPSAIARPAFANEAVEVVRFALAQKLALLPLGSRSKCELGMPSERYDIALDMTGLKEIAHYDAGDLTLSVDAGIPMRTLEMHLKKSGQFLPLAVPCFESATVGGTVASGIDSALRLQYGSARDFLIGAEFIDGTGQLCKSGGRVVKNVTGYDLHKLLIGSLGTLGVITRLNFRTFPLPAVSGGHLACFKTLDDVLEYHSALERSGLPLANLEILSPVLAGMLWAILQRSEEKYPEELQEKMWYAYSSAEGSDAVVRRIARDLERIGREKAAAQCRVLETNEDQALGGMLREAFEWLRWASPANVICRLSLPTLNARALSTLLQMAESNTLRSALLVRAVGIVYFAAFADSKEEQAIEAVAKVGKGVAALAQGEKGHCTLLHAPLTVKTKLAGANPAKINRNMQLRMKKAFDPSGVFAPGRIVGGI
jgi:glycolate oxidase FAD binding subunit